MKRNTRTQWGNMSQVANQLGIRHNVLPHTTLNEKFGFRPDDKSSNAHVVECFCIGFGGHRGYMSNLNVYLSTSIDHYPDHAALYRHLPFLIREPGNDLSADERNKYAGRVLLTDPDGKTWIAYMLKVLSKENLSVGSYRSVRAPDGTVTSDEYTPDSSALNPTPPKLDVNNIDKVVTSSTFYNANAELDLSLTPADCAELMTVARVLYRDEQYALVSEYGIVSGSFATVSGDNGLGGQIQYRELIQSQIVNFLTNRGSAADDSDAGVECYVNFGATEATLADSGANATFIGQGGGK